MYRSEELGRVCSIVTVDGGNVWTKAAISLLLESSDIRLLLRRVKAPDQGGKGRD